MTGAREVQGPVWVVVPTFQESASIEPLLEGVHAHLRPVVAGELRVLVVDDGSPDGTADLADAVGERLGCVEVIRRDSRQGLASAYRAGFARALAGGARLVVQMDADLSHDPAVLPALVRATAHADLVLGSRYVRGGGIEDWGRVRRAVSRGGSAYSRRILALRVRDLTGGFKCFRAEALAAIDLDSLRSRGYAFQIETTYRVSRLGLRVAELPITFRDRRAGESKMTLRIALEAAWRVPGLRLARGRGNGPWPEPPIGSLRSPSPSDAIRNERALRAQIGAVRRPALVVLLLALTGAGAVFAATRSSAPPAKPPHPVPALQLGPTPRARAAGSAPVAAAANPNRRLDVKRALALYGTMQKTYWHTAEHLYIQPTVPGGRLARPSFLWPYSQGVAATLAAASVPGGPGKDALSSRVAGFERYWDGTQIPAYAFKVQAGKIVPNVHKYYDDEGWVGMDLLRIRRVTGDALAFRRAQQVFDFMVSGWDADPHHGCPGGVLWKQPPNNTTRTAVSTATAGELAVALYQLTGRASYLGWARSMEGWVTRCLARGDGLLRDHVDRAGHVEPSVWSYNQGSSLALEELLSRATGDASYHARALRIARAAVRHFSVSRLAGETQIFPAIFFDDLLRLPTGAAEHLRWRAAAQRWADYEWRTARDSGSGLVRRPRRTPAQLIDQASLVWLYSDLAHDGAGGQALAFDLT